MRRLLVPAAIGVLAFALISTALWLRVLIIALAGVIISVDLLKPS